MKNKYGVSLIALIITIIVIIVLASIVMYSSYETVGKAMFSKFVHEFGEYTDRVTITLGEREKEAAIKNEKKSIPQYYYEIATNTRLPMQTEPTATGLVAELEIQTVPENVLTGREFYTILSDTYIDGYNKEAQFYGDSNGKEMHYVTDTGIVFTLPGFPVQQEDGIVRYYITNSAYYEGTPYNWSNDIEDSEDQETPGDAETPENPGEVETPEDSESPDNSGEEEAPSNPDDSGDEENTGILITANGWHYNPTTGEIVGFSGHISNNVSIPGQITQENGSVIDIKVIKELELSKDIKDLKVGEGIEEINDGCFEGSWKLKNVELPNSLKKIGDNCFANSEKLEEIKLPSNLEQIGDGAFKNCDLRTITIPESVEHIGNNAFANNNNLKQVYINKPQNYYTNEELKSFGIDPSKVVYTK